MFLGFVGVITIIVVVLFIDLLVVLLLLFLFVIRSWQLLFFCYLLLLNCYKVSTIIIISRKVTGCFYGIVLSLVFVLDVFV